MSSDVYILGFINGLRPEPRLTVSEWADTKRYLDSKSSAEPGLYRTSRTPYVREIADNLSVTSIVKKVIVMKGAQVGLALDVNTPLPTPTGWTTMGNVKNKDRLFDEKGNECTVTFCTEIMYNRDCYQVTFSDGSKISSDGKHKWQVSEFSKNGKFKRDAILTTEEMFPCFKHKARNLFSVKNCLPLLLPDQRLITPPYTLGLWLGNGNSYSNRLTCHIEDIDELKGYIINEGIRCYSYDKHSKGNCAEIILDPRLKGICKRGHVLSIVGKIYGRCRKCHNQRTQYYQRGYEMDSVVYENSFFSNVVKLGISPIKRIPKIYLRGSFSQRLSLLCGLMDTDGHVNKGKGHCCYYTVSLDLANDVIELITSLGMKPVTSKKKSLPSLTRSGREINPSGNIYVISFKAYKETPVVRLKRKLKCLISESDGRSSETYQRRIVNIEKIESLPVRCIQVDSPSHLYLAGKGMIPTHNTEVGNNWMGYIIDCAPGPILSVMPTDSMVERNSKMRIAPMITASPSLSAKIKSSRSRDSGNTITQKEFPGGVLIMAGANSGTGLRSMPARFVMADEVDAYPMDVDGEGSPMSLMEKRTSTFSNKKIFELSTPTVQGLSTIEADFLQTDQRYFHVPCPHCGTMQGLKFEQLKWEPGKYDETAYECEHCKERIADRYKGDMISKGYWVASKPENSSPYTVGYHISALYSPPGWKSWAEIAEEWDKGQGDENKLKSFYNTLLGLTWKVKTDAPEWELLHARAEDYPLNVAKRNVAVITIGADVQADRIELEIVGWMPNRVSQQIDYRVLMGDTTKPGVWGELDKIINESFLREDGVYLPVRLMAIDSGYNSAKVYSWARKYGFSRVVPIKGQESLQQFYSPPRAVDTTKHGKKIGKQKVWHVGVNFIKTETYGFFRQTIDPETNVIPEGYCYFPKREPAYFRGLTAEVVQAQRNKKGYVVHLWVKKYARNEPLDCRVYARAASTIIGIDNWKPERWQREGQLAVSNAYTPPPEIIEQPTIEVSANNKSMPSNQIVKKTKIQKKKSSFWDR